MSVKKTLAVSTAALALIGSALPASAAEVNADYVSTLVKSGTAELILNVDAYRAAYSDLDAAFGDDTNAYLMHYLTTGMYEGRTEGVLFNPLAYADAYSDIKEAFGDDISAVVNHYVTTGITEARTAGTADGYADIAEAEREAARESSSPLTASGTPSYNSTGGTGSSTSGSTGSLAAADTSTGSPSVSAPVSNNVIVRDIKYYTNDEQTLLRVEYYNAGSQMVEYSVVANYDHSTKSYTEYIYSCSTCTLLRTNIYVNGALVSSVSN